MEDITMDFITASYISVVEKIVSPSVAFTIDIVKICKPTRDSYVFLEFLARL